MRRGTLLLTVVVAAVVVAACRGQGGSERAPRRAVLAPRDSMDSVLATPLVVVKPAVVVFWLAASDSLLPDEAAEAYDELTLAAGGIVEALAAYEIDLLPTHSDTVYVELLDRRRRPIILSGLDFPFGFVLIEPGSSERLLAGVYGEADLLDEIRVYFDLPEDSTRAPPRVTTE